MMKAVTRCCGMLVQAFDKHPGYEHLRSQHASQLICLPNSTEIVAFVPPIGCTAEKNRLHSF